MLLLLLSLHLASIVVSDITALAQDDAGEVYIVPITGTIDLGMAPFLERVVGDAEQDGAAAILLEVDTPGGALDAVLQMRDTLLGAEVPTIAFVDRNAFSAGALVAIASEQIYMTPGAAMGAATPVDGVTGEDASEKVISAVRATFASTAEARGRDPIVAEAMVDPDVEIPGLVEAGELLTLTNTQAIDWGYSEGTYETREDVLAALGLQDAPVVETSMSFAEELVRFLTNPLIATLLLLGGMILIIGDFFTEGIGLAAAAGLGCLALFFYGHMLAGLAGWEDVLLVLIGVVLIAVEIFVIPGFGVFGVLGLVALAAGMYLAMANRDERTPEESRQAMLVVGVVLIGLVLSTVALLYFLPRSRTIGRLVLRSNVGDAEIDQPQALPSASRDRGWLKWFGGGTLEPATAPAMPETADRPSQLRPHYAVSATGTALSDLRPAGIGSFDGRREDVVTSGEYIEAGAAIEVVRDDQYRLVVRKLST